MGRAKLQKIVHADDLPEEIMREEILSRLPTRSLVRFRCVCTRWNSVLSRAFILSHSSYFQNPDKKYLISKTEDPNSPHYYLYNIAFLSRPDLVETRIQALPFPRSIKDIHLLGSVNGLVCIALVSESPSPHNNSSSSNNNSSNFHFILWNPSVCVSKKISQPPESSASANHIKRFGFGWDSEADDYKIILKSYLQPTYNFVYSSKTDSWTKNFDGGARFTSECCTPSVIVDGCPYWNGCPNCLIIKFDVKTHMFRIMVVSFAPFYTLITINNCLALIKHEHTSNGVKPNLQVYSFNGEHNPWTWNRWTWSETYTIEFDENYISACLGYDGPGEIVFNGEEKVYDQTSKRLIINDKGYFSDGLSYTPSLVALEGMHDVVNDSSLPRP